MKPIFIRLKTLQGNAVINVSNIISYEVPNEDGFTGHVVVSNMTYLADKKSMEDFNLKFLSSAEQTDDNN